MIMNEYFLQYEVVIAIVGLFVKRTIRKSQRTFWLIAASVSYCSMKSEYGIKQQQKNIQTDNLFTSPKLTGLEVSYIEEHISSCCLFFSNRKEFVSGIQIRICDQNRNAAKREVRSSKSNEWAFLCWLISFASTTINFSALNLTCAFCFQLWVCLH